MHIKVIPNLFWTAIERSILRLFTPKKVEASEKESEKGELETENEDAHDEPVEIEIIDDGDEIRIVIPGEEPGKSDRRKITEHPLSKKERLMMELGMIDDYGEPVGDGQDPKALKVEVTEFSLFDTSIKQSRPKYSFDDHFIRENPDLYEVIRGVLQA